MKPWAALYWFSICALSQGCKQPCEGLLECGAQSTYNSVVVFAQATTTDPVRSQDKATLTIQGVDADKDEWTLNFTDSSDSTMVIGTQTGSAYQVPYEIGTTSLQTEIWNAPYTNNQQLLRLGDWWLSTYPNANNAEIEAVGALIIEHAEGTQTLMIQGNQKLQQWPAKVFPCGDLDGDAQPDWIAIHLDDNNSGVATLGLSTIWTQLSNTVTFTHFPILSGSLTSEGFGHAVLCDRDWTGDGNIDLLISSPFANVNGITSAGRIQLFKNVFISDELDPFIKLSSISGSRTHEWLGYRITAGDIDGDGKLELASTVFEDTNSTVKLWTWLESQGNTWRERYTIRSPKSNTFFGYDIHIANINGDDKEDLLVGEPYYDSEKSETGLVTIFKGTNSLLDWNTKFDLIFGSQAYAHLGRHIYTHDLNQDGIEDIILPVIEVE